MFFSQISPPDLAIPVYNLRQGISDEKVKLYYRFMIHLATKFRVPMQKALVELGSALQFEMNLAQVSINDPNVEIKYVVIDDICIVFPNNIR